MANTSSAKKAHRASLRRAVYNLRRKKAAKEQIKALGKALAEKSGSAAAMLPALQQALDKAVKGGTMHKNTAARIKSRLSKRVAASGK